jgi:hypothetical protein
MALDGDDTSSTVYLDDLNPVNPAGDTAKSQGDDHLRFIKRAIKNTFPNITGIVTPTHTELNYVDGVLSQLAGITDTATLTNKTLTSPAINGASLNNTITLNGEFSANSKTISAAELGTLDGSDTATTIQAQLNAKLDENADVDLNNNDLLGVKNAVFEGEVTTTSAIDWSSGSRQKITLTGNTTFTFSTAPVGAPCNLILKVTQAAVGGYTVSFPSSAKWGASGIPVQSTTANKIDLYLFYYDGTNYYGSQLKGF